MRVNISVDAENYGKNFETVGSADEIAKVIKACLDENVTEIRMDNIAELANPPFDKPIGFVKLFDAKTRAAIMETINQVRDNAIQIAVS